MTYCCIRDLGSRGEGEGVKYDIVSIHDHESGELGLLFKLKGELGDSVWYFQKILSDFWEIVCIIPLLRLKFKHTKILV